MSSSRCSVVVGSDGHYGFSSVGRKSSAPPPTTAASVFDWRSKNPKREEARKGRRRSKKKKEKKKRGKKKHLQGKRKCRPSRSYIAWKRCRSTTPTTIVGSSSTATYYCFCSPPPSLSLFLCMWCVQLFILM